MKTLIVPDVHTHWEKANDLIGRIDADQVVLLGDYFDEFYDTVEQNVQTAKWLKGLLNEPNITCLLGNHDYAYWKGVWCSGVTGEKYGAIREVLGDEDFAKLVLTKTVGKWDLSHAGLDSRWRQDMGLWSPLSPIWVRPDDFDPTPVNQLFGHTKFNEPYIRVTGDYRQVCIDTRRNHYAILEDENLIIHDWKDLAHI